MSKYTGIAKKPKMSAAAKEAQTRNKALAKVSGGQYKGLPKSVSSRRMTKTEKRAVNIQPFAAKIVPQPPRTPQTVKGCSLKTLIRNTPRMMRENGQECKVSGIKSLRTAKGLPVVQASVKHIDPFRPNASDKTYDCMMVGLDDPNKPISKQKRVLVSCQCENWVYMWEYACAAHGAARIIYGNGEPPTMTNLAQVPALCKHLSGFADEVMERGL